MIAELVALTLLVALIAYTLTGGADFGGGVWDLLASGPRKAQQRHLIERTLAPIWEANHVWLILIVVVLFVALPHAYAAISTALHIPLVVFLIGIVLRGAAFVFRSYDPTPGVGAARWRLVFAIASVIAPIFLGVVMGSLATGDLALDADLRPYTSDISGFFEAWAQPFPFVVGLFVLVLFAWLAAVYLTVEAQDPALRRDFRVRALVTGVLAGVMSLVLLFIAGDGAPRLSAGLSHPVAVGLQVGVALVAAAALWALYREHYRVARVLAAAQVTVVVIGFGLAQWPHIIVPDMSFEAALAPESVVVPMLIVLACVAPILLVALVFLYRVFKASDSRLK